MVWAHNSHVGNAAATEMGQVRDEINIGKLARDRFGADAVLVGFGTDRGEVAAATDWDGPMEIKAVRPAHADSFERCSAAPAARAFWLDLARRAGARPRPHLLAPRLERAIGVIYRPETELLSHYFEASLPRQFDRYVWFEVTGAVTPLPTAPATGRAGDLSVRALTAVGSRQVGWAQRSGATRISTTIAPLRGQAQERS